MPAAIALAKAFVIEVVDVGVKVGAPGEKIVVGMNRWHVRRQRDFGAAAESLVH